MYMYLRCETCWKVEIVHVGSPNMHDIYIFRILQCMTNSDNVGNVFMNQLSECVLNV